MSKLRAHQMLAGLFFSGTLFAADAQIIEVTMDKPQFVVMLPANPTTGYQWTIISYDKTKIGFVKSVFQTPTKQQIMGAGGKMIFTFTARSSNKYPASSKIKFKYVRPWDPNYGTFTDVIVNVNKALPKPLTKNQ
ncbi:MAG: protease inhibitor I42 family protein [Legionellaceae bacterium]|nr:protease inhibitor I42 family protein [Legionellaceae bacterium]